MGDRGVCVTCAGGLLEDTERPAKRPRILEGSDKHDTFDFSSRRFFPTIGVNEDPVCGSAHCILAPFWAPRLGRGRSDLGESPLRAFQASPRGGVLRVTLHPEGRVSLEGQAVLVLQGRMAV